MKTVQYNRAIIAAGVVGVLVSTYALYVEMAAEARPGYKALCDISEYSKGFGIISADSKLDVPNCIYGTLFYCLMIFLAEKRRRRVAAVLAIRTPSRALVTSPEKNIAKPRSVYAYLVAHEL
ncbi:hypothetical protein ACJJTC_005615 [Scirpophaga incertulas]